MSVFSEILPLFGVDAVNSFMMVPAGGFNLIFHSLGKDTPWASGVGKDNQPTSALQIHDVTDAVRKAPVVTTISPNPKQPLFVDDYDMAVFIMTSYHKTFSNPSLRLLSVSSNTPGMYHVTFTTSRSRQGILTVFVLKPRPISISMRYLKYTGQWPVEKTSASDGSTYSQGSTRNKDEAGKYVNLLDKVFRHQANIPITLKSSDDLKRDIPFDRWITKDFFKTTIAPNLDPNADFTGFVVPYFKEGYGMEFPLLPRVLALEDNPHLAVNWGSTGDIKDMFLILLAHELGHGLGIHSMDSEVHLHRDGAITTDQRDGLLIDQDALGYINSPLRK